MAIPFTVTRGEQPGERHLSSQFCRRSRTPLQTVISIALVLIVSSISLKALPSTAARKQQARDYYEKAEQMREALNGQPASERTRKEYQRVADAYRKVYYVAPMSSKADASVVAVAEILVEMGRQFPSGDKDFRAAIGEYEFLRREYPGSKYRFQALFTIGQIYKEDLGDDDAAKQTFEEFLHHYPRNSLAPDAKQALAELNAPKPAIKPPEEEAHTPEKDAPATAAATTDETPTPVAATKRKNLPMVTGIRHWSTPDYTRVAIDVDSEVKYEAGRVPDPDRIFFDLPNTKLASFLVGKSFDVQDGFLKKIRVAQYQPGYTRVVLEVADISDYSAFILPNPYRLIIDVHGRQPQSQTLIAKANASENAVYDDDSGAITAVEKENSYRSVEKANEAKSALKPAANGSTSSSTPTSATTQAKSSVHNVVVDNDDTTPSKPPAKSKAAKNKSADTTNQPPAPDNGVSSADSSATSQVAGNKPPDPLFSGPRDTSGPELKATDQPTTAPTAVAVAPRAKNSKKKKAADARLDASRDA